jgi:hypothetical protein
MLVEPSRLFIERIDHDQASTSRVDGLRGATQGVHE